MNKKYRTKCIFITLHRLHTELILCRIPFLEWWFPLSKYDNNSMEYLEVRVSLDSYIACYKVFINDSFRT